MVGYFQLEETNHKTLELVSNFHDFMVSYFQLEVISSFHANLIYGKALYKQYKMLVRVRERSYAVWPRVKCYIEYN